MVEMDIFNIYTVQRAVNPKVDKLELWFLCSALCLMVFYICERFHEISHKRFSTYREDMIAWWKWLCSTFKGQ